MKTVKFCAQTSPIGKSFVVNFLLCCFGWRRSLDSDCWFGIRHLWAASEGIWGVNSRTLR
jgi:hypothetical protein